MSSAITRYANHATPDLNVDAWTGNDAIRSKPPFAGIRENVARSYFEKFP